MVSPGANCLFPFRSPPLLLTVAGPHPSLSSLPGTVVPSSPHSFAPVVPLASCSSPSFHILESHPSLSVLPSVLHFIDNAFPINLTYIRNTGMNSPGHKIEALQIGLTSTDKRQQALFLLESKGYYLCAADSSRVISMHLYTYIRTSRKLCFLCV